MIDLTSFPFLALAVVVFAGKSRTFYILFNIRRKKKRSDSVIYQKPHKKSKKQRDNIKTPPKPRLLNDCGPT